MKLIREARMGAPKSFKTGAIVGSYPKPLLYLGFDRGGIDVIPSRSTLASLNGNLIKPDVAYEDIKFIKPEELFLWTAKPESEQPPVLAIQFYEAVPLGLTLDFTPTKTSKPFQDFVDAYNSLTNKPVLPWKTIVLDSASGYSELVLNHLSSFNNDVLMDARQWAPMVAGKLKQVILSMTSLPCHIAITFHVYVEKNELTQEIRELPDVYSNTLRNDLFGLFSQVFYACQVNGSPVVWPSERYPVKGIGPRWPIGLPSEVKPDFMSIYGKELQSI